MTETSREEQISASEKFYDRLFHSAFKVSVCFLCVFLGLLMAAVKAPPYYWTQNAFDAFNAICVQQDMFADENSVLLWQPVRFSGSSVVGSTSSEGATLYTAGDSSAVQLIDGTGNVLHQWNATFSQIWGNQDFMKSMVPDERIFVRRAHVYPNGDLLALYETPLNTPNGMGFARLDRDSNVIWKFDGNCHHDFALGDDEKVYSLTHRLRASTHPQCVFGPNDVNIEDFLTVISPEGEKLKEFSLLDAFYESPFNYQHILLRDHKGDLLHANTVNLVDEAFASHYEEVDAGDLIVCFRNMNLLVVVDPELEKIVWGTSGPWHFPHDPDPLPNGNILIFDNCVCDGTTAYSRIVEFDPRSREVVWTYSGKGKHALRSNIRSTQQRLANGNTLIGESNGGRILEVDLEGNVVWQFINPTRSKDGKLVPIMTGVARYQKQELKFLEEENLVAMNP